MFYKINYPGNELICVCDRLTHITAYLFLLWPFIFTNSSLQEQFKLCVEILSIINMRATHENQILDSTLLLQRNHFLLIKHRSRNGLYYIHPLNLLICQVNCFLWSYASLSLMGYPHNKNVSTSLSLSQWIPVELTQ